MPIQLGSLGLSGTSPTATPAAAASPIAQPRDVLDDMNLGERIGLALTEFGRGYNGKPSFLAQLREQRSADINRKAQLLGMKMDAIGQLSAMPPEARQMFAETFAQSGVPGMEDMSSLVQSMESATAGSTENLMAATGLFQEMAEPLLRTFNGDTTKATEHFFKNFDDYADMMDQRNMPEIARIFSDTGRQPGSVADALADPTSYGLEPRHAATLARNPEFALRWGIATPALDEERVKLSMQEEKETRMLGRREASQMRVAEHGEEIRRSPEKRRADELREMGVPESVATDVEFGHTEVTDTADGRLIERNKLTGETRDITPAMPARPRLEQATDTSMGSDMASTVGPGPRTQEIVNKYIGGFVPGATDRETARNRQNLRLLERQSRSAFTLSSRPSAWEQSLIKELFPSEGFFESPEAAEEKLRQIKSEAARVYNTYAEMLEDPTVKDRGELVQKSNELKQLFDSIQVPASKDARRARSAPASGGASRYDEMTLDDLLDEAIGG